MGSNDVDDFLVNFDLNHLTAEENIQSPDKKYEKIRKNTSWLKSKIISTDFVIQKYQSKKELYEQSVKAHSVTKEELRQACINYNDAIQRCGNLEEENKMLLANQETLKGKATDVEHKYEALLSHTNQLQMLVKQLENEKDALSVEKELDKSNNVDIIKEMKTLKKEKDIMLNDIKVFKDVILGTRKRTRDHIKMLKKYVKQIKSTTKILSTSGESDDESNNYDNKSLHNKKALDKGYIVADKVRVSNPELNFIDISSDEEVSVDTGRGSSRANSHEKYLSSPDYVAVDIVQRTPPKNFIKQIDAANSPITVYPPITVATSPITFDQHDPMIEDQHDNYNYCFDDAEYINDEVPLSHEISLIVEEEKMSDCDDSPPQDQNENIDESKLIEGCKYIIVEAADTCSDQLFMGLDERNEFTPDFIINKQFPKCLCEKTDTVMGNDKQLIDACTSPLPLSPDLRKYVDIGTSTHENDNLNLDKSNEFEIRTPRKIEKSTDILVLSDKMVNVNDFKIPILKSHIRCTYVHVGTNTDNNMEFENQMSRNCEKSTLSKERNHVDVSTSPILIPHEQRELIDVEADVVCEKQTEKRKRRRSLFSDHEDTIIEEESSCVIKRRSSNIRDDTITNPKEKLKTQEKVCLETNSSKSLHFERTNDSEVQNILNVMRLRHDLISPISDTPSSSHYLKLIPEMNSTISKIWKALSTIYRIPNQLNGNESDSLNCTEIELLPEIPEEEINNSQNDSDQPLDNDVTSIVRTLNQVVEDDILDSTNTACSGINNTDSSNSHQPNMINRKVSNVIKASRTKSDVFYDKSLPESRTDTVNVMAEGVKRNPKQAPKINSTDLNENSEDNMNNSNKINEEIFLANKPKQKSDSHQDRLTNSFKSSDIFTDDNPNHTDNNNEICDNVRKPAVHTILSKGTKTKKKSKLEKFRDKLLPPSKIKQITPVIKHRTKTYIKPKDTTALSLLNQKVAYEHAVKVMTEVRSTRELQESNSRKMKPLKLAKEDTDLASKASKTDSSSKETIEVETLTTKSKASKTDSSSKETIEVETLTTKSKASKTDSSSKDTIEVETLTTKSKASKSDSSSKETIEVETLPTKSKASKTEPSSKDTIEVETLTTKSKASKSDSSSKETIEVETLPTKSKASKTEPSSSETIDLKTLSTRSKSIRTESSSSETIDLKTLSTRSKSTRTESSSSETIDLKTLSTRSKSTRTESLSSETIDLKTLSTRSKSSRTESSSSETIDLKTLSTRSKSSRTESSSSETIDLKTLSTRGKTESSPSGTIGLKMLSTRNPTRMSSKKEEDTTAITIREQNIRNSDQSSAKRLLRKRPADGEVENIQTSSKRVLRSSNVILVDNENVSPGRNSRTRNDPERNSKRKGNAKNLADSFNEHCESTDLGNNHNLKIESCGSRNKLAAAGSDILRKNVIQSKKPVIELSECLVDNDNVVSIIAGKDSEKSNVTSNSAKIDSRIEKQVVNLPQHEASKVSKETKNAGSTNIKEYTNNKKMGNKGELIEEQDNIPMIRTEEILHVNHNDITNRKDDTIKSLVHKLQEEAKVCTKNPVVQLTPCVISNKNNVINYGDLDLFTVERNDSPDSEMDSIRRNDNVLCAALDRKAPIFIRYCSKKVPDSITHKISQELEKSTKEIIESYKSAQKSKLNDLVNNIKNFSMKHIISGVMKYLKDPTRKAELYNKVTIGQAPPMTKSEMVLLYVVQSLNKSWPDFTNKLLNTIEHALFQLNRAPEFDVIESLSHFFAVLCKYYRMKSRIRCFIMDSMYCLQYKAVPLIRHCLDVYPRLLPNSHERMAKTSLVTCLVYLLHFYKCQDKFNRAQDIRNILYQRYHYRFSEWNENMILQIFRKAIMDLRGTQNDKNMLRIALIILCKRNGAKWCQVNIIQNMLLPIIDKKDVPERIKQFGVLMLGPLLKPFPADRKAQCEIVINQLLQMLAQESSQTMKEAIYSSLIFMNKHDQDRVVEALLTWNPEAVSPEFEEILNDYVMEKPLTMWKKLVVKNASRSS